VNRISTRAQDWHGHCEKWAAAQEPFHVIDVNKDDHPVFFMFVCSVYKFALTMDGETIAILEPREREQRRLRKQLKENDEFLRKAGKLHDRAMGAKAKSKKRRGSSKA
jgi:hypothetical protein